MKQSQIIPHGKNTNNISAPREDAVPITRNRILVNIVSVRNYTSATIIITMILDKYRF